MRNPVEFFMAVSLVPYKSKILLLKASDADTLKEGLEGKVRVCSDGRETSADLSGGP
jgi:hypothetical protein